MDRSGYMNSILQASPQHPISPSSFACPGWLKIGDGVVQYLSMGMVFKRTSAQTEPVKLLYPNMGKHVSYNVTERS